MCGKTCIYKCIHTHTDTHKHWLSSLAHISHTDTLSHFPNHVVFCHCSDLLPDRYLFLFRQGLCLCVWMCICVSGCVSAIWVVIYSTKSQREFIQQDQEDVPGLSCPNNFRGRLRRTCTHAHEARINTQETKFSVDVNRDIYNIWKMELEVGIRKVNKICHWVIKITPLSEFKYV